MFQLLPSQVKFINDNETKYLAFVAGYGSGKTTALCAKAVELAAQNIGYDLAMIEPTTPLIRKIIIPKMEEHLLTIGIPYKLFSTANPRFILHFAEGDCTIHLISGENYQRIIGFEVASVLIDEIDIIPQHTAENMLTRVIGRMRVGNVRQVAMASTPESFGFLYNFFIKNPAPNKRLIKASTYENIAVVGQEYIDSMIDQYPANVLQAYLYGEFVNLHSGNVYAEYDRHSHHTSKTVKSFADNKILNVGCDFNINHMTAIVHIVENNIIYAVDEFVELRDTDALIKAIIKKYPKRTIYIYPDSSGKSEKTNANVTDIQKLQAVFGQQRVFFKKKNPPIMDRVASVNAKVLNGKGEITYYINENTCPTLTECFETQGWKDGKPDKTTGLDHPPDATGYFVYYRFPIKKPKGITVT